MAAMTMTVMATQQGWTRRQNVTVNSTCLVKTDDIVKKETSKGHADHASRVHGEAKSKERRDSTSAANALAATTDGLRRAAPKRD